MRRLYPVLRSVAIVVTVVAALLTAQNAAINAYFPRLARLTTDFSPTYLKRELSTLAAPPQSTIFLGDSVLWGYRLQPDQTAVSLLAAHGCRCVNLAFKSANPANYYALASLLRAFSVRPKVVVIEVDQRVFNPADGEYKTLHPAVAALARPLLSPLDRAKLTLPAPEKVPVQWIDRLVTRSSLLYAMRSDVRETLFGDVDPAPAQRPTPDFFEGTYDLSPLDEANIAVHFLEETVDLLGARRVAVVAFLTPTNHALLHDYIDSPEYRANGAYLRTLLERRGARVLDFDATFPTGEFLDNNHLTPAGQHRLAALLAAALSK